MRFETLTLDRRNAMSLCSMVSDDFTLNVSHSIPVGYYFRCDRAIERGSIVTVRGTDILPADLLKTLYANYWRARHMKRVVAVAGDTVAAQDERVSVNGALVARRHAPDRWRREFGCEIPWWTGERVLGVGELFLLGDCEGDAAAYSVDGRYTGPLAAHLADGVWTLLH